MVVETVPNEEHERTIVYEEVIQNDAEEKRYIHGFETEQEEEEPRKVIFRDEQDFATRLISTVCIESAETSSRESIVTPETVSKKWGIGLETAE